MGAYWLQPEDPVAVEKQGIPEASNGKDPGARFCVEETYSSEAVSDLEVSSGSCEEFFASVCEV